MKLLRKISLILIIFGISFIIYIKIISIFNIKFQKHAIDNTNINYISIPSLNIKNILVNGITEKNLNHNYATMEINDNIIIAGHSVESVFKKLRNIKINDEINIFYNNILYTYYVEDKTIVNVNKFNGFKKTGKLYLITCIDKKHRLIITTKK